MPYRYIPIEKKHTYNNFSQTFTYGLSTAACCMIFKPTWPTTQGLTSSQRIGDKISPSSMVLDFQLQHATSQGTPFVNETFGMGYTYSGTLTNGTGSISTPNTFTGYKPNHDWISHFRLFLLSYEDNMPFDTAAFAKSWYEDNFVPYVYPSDEPVVEGKWTNQIDLLRETTDDTGQFSILFDHKFTLSNRKSIYHFSKTFPLKGTVNFETPLSTEPTNRRYVFILFGPLNYFDFDYSMYPEFSVSGVQVTGRGVLKLNYIDI